MAIGYKGTISEFLANTDGVIARLLENGANYCVLSTQGDAWKKETEILQNILGDLDNHDKDDGRIFFEYEIPRMNKRIDVVLLLRGIIFVLEYKISLNNSQNKGG